MTQNDGIKMHKCVHCNYSTKRKFDLKRHHYAKHFNTIFEKNAEYKMCENVHPFGENVHPPSENVHPSCENVHPKFICKKCNKTYKSKRYLSEHEKKCKGIDELTCPKCMLSFSSRQAKANHINRNNCKARSIIYARKPKKNTNNIINNIKQYNAILNL